MQLNKVFAAASLFVGVGTAAPAVPLLTENFMGYNTGDIVGQGSWDATGTANADKIVIQAGDLNFTPLVTDSGDRSAFLEGTGEDVGKSFGAQADTAGTTLYYSLVLRVVDSSTVTFLPGTYVAHFTEGNAASGFGFRGRLFVGETAEGNPRLGIDISSGDTPAYASTALSYGSPIFAVVKLTYNGGTTDDTAQLFVNKTGPTEPATADAEETGVDFAAIGRFGLRQGSNTNTWPTTIDKIRVGTTWSDVVQYNASVSEWSIY